MEQSLQSNWQVKSNLKFARRGPEKLDSIAESMVKEKKSKAHTFNLSGPVSSIPAWETMVKEKKFTPTSAIDVLLSIGGTLNEIEYIIQKMYKIDRTLFPKGWGGFIQESGEIKKRALINHIKFRAAARNDNPKKGFVFESNHPIEELSGDTYVRIIGTWNNGRHLIQDDNNAQEIKADITGNYDNQPATEEGVRRLAMSSDNLYDYFKIQGYYFPNEILSRYFLSLKTKPFVILTGISGTGKTKIAQIFADYICQNSSEEEKEKRIAFVSVRPDWVDNKGLLGFYNILDEKYYATPFLKIILEAMENPKKPYFVIFDEMNLAKVEQYFSDFLSVMESRTSDNKAGAKVFLHSVQKAQTDDKRNIPKEINIPSNIFFTGTVNVDETTYMFSPKVLDRANVIEFNDVDLEQYKSGVASKERYLLKTPDVRDNLLSTDQEPFCSKNDYADLINIIKNDDNHIEELSIRLKKYNMHFGYRVVNEISRFLCLSKALIERFSLNEGIDIQILQKILPKLHGTQGKLEEPLNDMFCFCYGEQYQKGRASDDRIEKAMEYDGQARFPRSAQKIARMINNLKTQDYTSFIE